MLSENANSRVLESIGEYNYNEYMLLTNGKEINSILNSRSPVFEMYKYRDTLLDKQKDISIDMNNLKQSLEQIFLDYLTDSEFEMIKDILINHILGWNLNRLLEIHKKYKGYRIFRILSINYKDWLN